MAKDTNNLTKDLLGMAKAKGLDMGQISKLVGSPEGQSLMAQLNGPGGGALKDAAAKAAGGDTAAISALMGALMSTKEGQSLAQQIGGLTQKD